MFLAQREGACEKVMGEGWGCESQELINAQRTVLMVERGRAGFESCSPGSGDGIWLQLGLGEGNGPQG